MLARIHAVQTVFSAPLMLSFNRKLPNLTRLIGRPISSCQLRQPTKCLSIRRFATGRISKAAKDKLMSKGRATDSVHLFRGICTLDPSRLTKDDYIDFSLKIQPVLPINLQKYRSIDSPAPSSSCSPRISAYSLGYHMFPPNTRGFMYYHIPPNGSPLAGELRFRLTSSDNPASFATGVDLLTDRDIPWRYPLYKLMCRPSHQDTISLLLQDGLVSQQTVDLVTTAVLPLHPTGIAKAPRRPGDSGAALSALNARHPARMAATPVLSAFGEEFDLRYSAGFNFCAVFASQDAYLNRCIRNATSFKVKVEGKYVDYGPFRGSVVCCFERSTLPEHAGRRVVVIRIKRFIDSDPILDVPAPVNLSIRRRLQIEGLHPRAGELLKTPGHRLSVKEWAADVDKVWSGKRVPWKALRVLFENDELYRTLLRPEVLE